VHTVPLRGACCCISGVFKLQDLSAAWCDTACTAARSQALNALECTQYSPSCDYRCCLRYFQKCDVLPHVPRLLCCAGKVTEKVGQMFKEDGSVGHQFTPDGAAGAFAQP
jgi:hypothetical protein